MIAVVVAAALAHASGFDVRDVAYGREAKQHIDVYTPTSTSATATTTPPTSTSAMTTTTSTSTALRPVLVFFHGGVWQFGDRRNAGNVGVAAVDAGFVGVVASYRLAPAARWPAQRDDAVAVVAHVVAHAKDWGGDPTRVVLVGHSAGGQLVGTLLYDPALLRAAGVDPAVVRGVAFVSGVFDLRAPLDEGQDDGGFARFVAPVFGDRVDVLRAASPLDRAVDVQTPLLFVTGDGDYRAMREQTFAMARRVGMFTPTRAPHDVVDVGDRDHFGLIAELGARDPVGRALFSFARACTAR